MARKPSYGLSPATIETVSGVTAGVVSTIVVHPLDIIKTRLQVDASSHVLLYSSRTVFRDIWRNEGPTRIAALYRGLSPNLVGNSAAWGLYFLWYREAQDLIRNVRGYSASQQLTTVDYLMSSSASGLLSAILVNPIWVLKTRMITTSATQSGAYPSMLSGFKSIFEREGVRGFFHGLTPALFGVVHGSLYFMAYEQLKLWQRNRKPDRQLSNTDTLIASSLSKIFAGTLTYPHQVVRTRMQAYDPSATVHVRGPGLVALVKRIWVNEGIVGFYKGLVPNLLRVVPSNCVTFLVYENMRWALPRFFGENDQRNSGVNRKNAL